MTTSAKVSYAFIALMLGLVCVLHLSTPFITLLFSYFALTKLRLGQGKSLAVMLFLVVTLGACTGAYFFVNQAVVALPKIAETAIPEVIKYAGQNNIDLPFQDYESLKELVADLAAERVGGIGKFARTAVVEVISFLIGLVAAVSLFMNARFQLEPDPQAVKDNLYASVWLEIGRRFSTFYVSFATVMGAQLVISAINTALTSVFVLWNDFPYASVIIVLTFLCGLLPIVGNLISNTLIVGVAFTIEPKLALLALLFLVALHKLEYFLNSKIIGHRIKNPMWLTLLGLIIGEKLMGIPGMILAPVILHYIKVEASRNKLSDLTDKTVPLQAAS